MDGPIVLFHFPQKTEQKVINRFMQKFYGQDSSSWNGKYRYHMHGFLEDIPHRKLLRGVIILRKSDVNRVLEFLGQYSMILHVREIKLTKGDERILDKSVL